MDAGAITLAEVESAARLGEGCYSWKGFGTDFSQMRMECYGDNNRGRGIKMLLHYVERLVGDTQILFLVIMQ